MAHTVESRAATPANQLRSLLDEIERRIVQLEPAAVESLLLQLDEAERTFETLEAEGVDLRAERTRWENVTRRLAAAPALIARPAARLPGGLAALRAAHPDASGPWWRADEVRARNVRKGLLQLAALVGGIVGVVLLGWWLLTTFFPPDPHAVALLNATTAIERAVDAQDWPTALQAVEQADPTVRDDPEVLLWEAVIAERTGDDARAAAARDAASAALPEDQVRILSTLAMNRVRAGDVEGARAAAQEATALDAQSAQAWYVLGLVEATAGDVQAALGALERAQQFAGEEQPEVAVNARMLMADLIRRPPIEGLDAPPTPAPTP
jgi:tetratricopeptide (TPR) repeat protein